MSLTKQQITDLKEMTYRQLQTAVKNMNDGQKRSANRSERDLRVYVAEVLKSGRALLDNGELIFTDGGSETDPSRRSKDEEPQEGLSSDSSASDSERESSTEKEERSALKQRATGRRKKRGACYSSGSEGSDIFNSEGEDAILDEKNEWQRRSGHSAARRGKKVSASHPTRRCVEKKSKARHRRTGGKVPSRSRRRDVSSSPEPRSSRRKHRKRKRVSKRRHRGGKKKKRRRREYDSSSGDSGSSSCDSSSNSTESSRSISDDSGEENELAEFRRKAKRVELLHKLQTTLDKIGQEGIRKQYRFNAERLLDVKDIARHLRGKTGKKLVREYKREVGKRQHLLLLADKYDWEVVAEYEISELAVGSSKKERAEDTKRISRAVKEVRDRHKPISAGSGKPIGWLPGSSGSIHGASGAGRPAVATDPVASSFPGKCHKCGKTGHKRQDCKKK